MSYRTGKSVFAQRITEVFDNAGTPIEGVNAGYASMFRSKDTKHWRDAVPEDAKELSLEVLTKIIEELKPPLIYVSGLRDCKRMGLTKLMGWSFDGDVEHGRRKESRDEFELLHHGNYRDTRVIASQHLSRLSRGSLNQIADALRRALGKAR
jgi:hypothetical protein